MYWRIQRSPNKFLSVFDEMYILVMMPKCKEKKFELTY